MSYLNNWGWHPLSGTQDFQIMIEKFTHFRQRLTTASSECQRHHDDYRSVYIFCEHHPRKHKDVYTWVSKNNIDEWWPDNITINMFNNFGISLSTD